jgi:glycosyltransferase involved in cell wall biosynthesis
MLKEVGNQIDPKRVAFPGRVDYATYLSLLQRSDAHIYLTYPFVASWSLREALATGCAVVGSDTPPVREFITHGENGLLTSFFDPPGVARSVLRILEDETLNRRLRKAARRYAEERLSMQDYLHSYEALIEQLTGQAVSPAVERPRVAAAGRRSRR